jgi:hypothetical protein
MTEKKKKVIRTNSNTVIRFPGPGSRTLKQIDLAEERLLTRYAREAVKALQEKREMIRRALEQGADLEPGTRSARMCKRAFLIIK